MRMLLCTGNAGKIAEMKSLLPTWIEVIGLAEAGIRADLPETGATLEANALEKARHAFGILGIHCLSDDTGLEVDALHGAPGVYSARYAGEAKDAQANVQRLLRELDGKTDRAARFRTVMALVAPDGEYVFEGAVEGTILTSPRGDGGFGYDPLFVPEGEERSFAEMDLGAKNKMSHRARAMGKVIDFLEEWKGGRV